jgi:DNA-binding response OmpR family regulator
MPKVIKKILIVEDEELILRALSEGFKRRGYEVIEAVDGKKGLEQIELQKPDVVMLDLMLPVMSGQEVLQKMKDKKLLNDSPVIILTNVSDDATLQECMKLGAKEYLIKSNFSFDEMERAIKKIAAE